MQQHVFVIPAYKNSPYLEECILSLKNQDMPSAIIITTATPSDYIETMAKKYQLPYYINSNKPSIAGDWNFALRQANAQWVTIAHQDDFYEKNYLPAIMKEIKKTENILMVFTNYSEIAGGRKVNFSLNLLVKRMMLWPFLFSKNIQNKLLKKSVLCFGDPVCCPAVTLHKALLPGFQFSEEYSCALDWGAWLQLANKKGGFVYLKEKLMRHRLHTASETVHQIIMGKRLQEERKILESIWGRRLGKFISKIYSRGQKGNMSM